MDSEKDKTLTTLTVTSGWTQPENYFSQDDGAYPVTLMRIGASEADGTFVDGATYEHTGQYGLKVKQTWQFALDNGEIIEQGVPVPKDGKLSPKSTYFGYASALVGRSPTAGTSFEQEALIGLRANAFIARDEDGFPRIKSLAALKQQAAAPVAPVAAPAPAAAPPLREAVAAGADSLPF